MNINKLNDRISLRNNIRSKLFSKEIPQLFSRNTKSYNTPTLFQIDHIKSKYGYNPSNSQTIKVRDSLEDLKKKYYLLEHKQSYNTPRANNFKNNSVIENFRYAYEEPNKPAMSQREFQFEKQNTIFYKRNNLSSFHNFMYNSSYLPRHRSIINDNSKVKKLAANMNLINQNEVDKNNFKANEQTIEKTFPISKRIVLLKNLKGNIKDVLQKKKEFISTDSLLNKKEKIDPGIKEVLNEMFMPEKNRSNSEKKHERRFFIKDLPKELKIKKLKKRKLEVPDYSTIL